MKYRKITKSNRFNLQSIFMKRISLFHNLYTPEQSTSIPRLFFIKPELCNCIVIRDSFGNDLDIPLGTESFSKSFYMSWQRFKSVNFSVWSYSQYRSRPITNSCSTINYNARLWKCLKNINLLLCYSCHNNLIFW